MKILKISELIKELEKLKNYAEADLEVFVPNSEQAQFEGITKGFVMKSNSDGKSYAVLLASGDILKI